MARTKALLGDAEKELFLRPNFAHLATIDPDGAPHVAPVWVDVEENAILVNTAKDRVKERNAREDPRVAISVHDQDNPYRMVSVTGRVVEITATGADDHIDEMAKKYLGQDQYPNRNSAEQRVIMKIEPERVASMGIV
ncbi:MAG TPA: PPOX class F420-dependent oxidoreductase [Actinomycetota bacterium]|nr:PPOX class F420-dependent oxidoreductase [Actinomycetota bacterium]